MIMPTHRNAIQRQQLLEALYAAREARPAQGWLNERDLSASPGGAAQGAAPGIAFALDVLAELGHVKRNGFELRITGAGVLACEQAQA